MSSCTQTCRVNISSTARTDGIRIVSKDSIPMNLHYFPYVLNLGKQWVDLNTVLHHLSPEKKALIHRNPRDAELVSHPKPCLKFEHLTLTCDELRLGIFELE